MRKLFCEDLVTLSQSFDIDAGLVDSSGACIVLRHGFWTSLARPHSRIVTCHGVFVRFDGETELREELMDELCGQPLELK